MFLLNFWSCSNLMSAAAQYYQATLTVTTGLSAPFNNLAMIYKQQVVPVLWFLSLCFSMPPVPIPSLGNLKGLVISISTKRVLGYVIFREDKIWGYYSFRRDWDTLSKNWRTPGPRYCRGWVKYGVITHICYCSLYCRGIAHIRFSMSAWSILKLLGTSDLPFVSSALHSWPTSSQRHTPLIGSISSLANPRFSLALHHDSRVWGGYAQLTII